MSQTINILQDFKNNIICFLDELIEQFPSEASLVIYRVFLKDQVPIITIMNRFIHEVLPNKDLIKNRSDSFFLNTPMGLFGNEKTTYFRNLWRSTVLDEEDRKIIWDWFDTFVYITEQYQKTKMDEFV